MLFGSGVGVPVGSGVVVGLMTACCASKGVGVAVNILTGVAVGVPVLSASAVPCAAMAKEVAAFRGSGVEVTTTGVTQLEGSGVDVP